MSTTDDDDDDDDTYIVHGQLLDPIQEDEVVKKIKSFDQIVKDENGRRRFHGAFTGGFSAGYFNTVGSSEGWTPATFKSSRDSKMTPKTQNVYDFFDEEDKKDLGIDSSSLKIKSEYSNYSSRKRIPEINKFVIPGKPVLGEILKPIKVTWGIELLKHMGWKHGQGVGPYLTNKQRQNAKNELENVGFNTKNMTVNDDEEDEFLSNIKFSPYEYESVAVSPKVDIFGLGYKSLNSTNVAKQFNNKYSKLTYEGKSIHGQAFGTGAFENQDDDIYATDNMSNYDFVLDNKSQEIKNKLNSNELNAEFINGFIEDDCKKNVFDVYSPLSKIPADWRPQGIFDRIVGQVSDNYNTTLLLIKEQKNINQYNQKISTSVNQIIENDIISDRFTKAKLPDDSTNALIPVNRTIDSALQRQKDFADKKMFGYWTRVTEPWIPDKLLCKRFNIPVSKQTMVKHEQKLKIQEESLFNSILVTNDSLALNNANLNIDTQINIQDSTKITNTETQFEKPNVDFFKDIFLNDNDNDNDYDNDNDVLTNHDTPKTQLKNEVVEHIPKTIDQTAPKGIFSNLNFDDLFKIDNKKNNDVNLSYGPLVPEHKTVIPSSNNITNIVNTFVENDWVEKVEVSKNNLRIKKKKKKKEKEKEKEKKKKKNSHKYK